jgi:hypothetical protein
MAARSTDFPELTTGSLKRKLDEDCSNDPPNKIRIEIDSLPPGSTVGIKISVNRSISNTNNVENSESLQIGNISSESSLGNLHPSNSSTNSPEQPSMSVTTENPSPSMCTETLLTASKYSENGAISSSSNSSGVPNDRNVRQTYDTQTNQDVDVVPIINLTPYQNKWPIKARVVYKTNIKTYNNAQKIDGKYFNFYLLDQTAEIRAVAFDANLHSVIEINEVYYIFEANVAEDSYDKEKLELKFTDNTRIKIAENSENFPYLKFDFQPIAKIKTLTGNTIVDVIGVCQNVTGLLKTEKKVRRELVLIDKGAVPIKLTLWGSEAEEFNQQNNPVIVVRNAKVNEFNNDTSLNVTPRSMLFVDPTKIPEVSELQSWYATRQSSDPSV